MVQKTLELVPKTFWRYNVIVNLVPPFLLNAVLSSITNPSVRRTWRGSVKCDALEVGTSRSDGRLRSDWPRLRGFAGVLLIIHCGWNALAVGTAITPVIPEAARPLPLGAVRLTGGPLRHAQDLNARYLLALEPDRMLAGYRIRAGLEPKAKGYGGWDSVEGKQLTGHVAGHYLSAVSLMYAVTGDTRFKERADYMVRELKEVQQKRGNGYLGAITDSEGTDAVVIFERVAAGDIRSGGFDLNGHVVALVHAAQDLRGFAGRVSIHREPDGAGTRARVCRVGRRDRLAPERFPGPADAQHRVWRDERDLRRSLCRHR